MLLFYSAVLRLSSLVITIFTTIIFFLILSIIYISGLFTLPWLYSESWCRSSFLCLQWQYMFPPNDSLSLYFLSCRKCDKFVDGCTSISCHAFAFNHVQTLSRTKLSRGRLFLLSRYNGDTLHSFKKNVSVLKLIQCCFFSKCDVIFCETYRKIIYTN